MENNTTEKDVMKEAKEYVSVSTRLPNVDAVLLSLVCKKEGITPSEYIRNLITKNIDSPQKNFIAGKNVIRYNKTTNSFSWFVELDSGQEVDILNALSLGFLKNLQSEIQEAIKERNQWVHQIHSDSVDIPSEMIGGKDE